MSKKTSVEVKRWVNKTEKDLNTDLNFIKAKITCNYIYSILMLETKSNVNFHDKFVKSGLSYDIDRANREGHAIKPQSLINIQEAFKTDYEHIYVQSLQRFYEAGPHNVFSILGEKDPYRVYKKIFHAIRHAIAFESFEYVLNSGSVLAENFTVIKTELARNEEYKKNRLGAEITGQKLDEAFKDYYSKNLIPERIVGLGALIYEKRHLFIQTRYMVLFALAVSIAENNFFLSPKSLNAIGKDAIKFCFEEYEIQPTYWNIKYDISNVYD